MFNEYLVMAAILPVVVVLMRPFLLWYWRINHTVALLEDNNRLLTALLATRRETVHELKSRLTKPAHKIQGA